MVSATILLGTCTHSRRVRLGIECRLGRRDEGLPSSGMWPLITWRCLHRRRHRRLSSCSRMSRGRLGLHPSYSRMSMGRLGLRTSYSRISMGRLGLQSSYSWMSMGRLGLRASCSGSFSDLLCWPLCCSEIQTSKP